MQKLDPQSGLGNQALMNQLELIRTNEAYQALTAPGLTIGTTSTAAVKIANTVTYLYNGAFKSKTTVEVAFAAANNIAANTSSVQEQLYILTLDGSGNPTWWGGGIFTGSGNALGPERSAITGSPIGSVRIAVAAGSTSFVGGTTALSNGALTVTYTDLGTYLPSFNFAM